MSMVACALLGGICGGALAQVPIDPPAMQAPNRYATTLKQLQNIVYGANGQTKIAAGQCVQLNDGNYLSDTSANATGGYLWLQTQTFSPAITIRSTTRRYKGYGPNGGLTTGGAISRKWWLKNLSGVKLDGLAFHRGNIGSYPLEPGVHIEGTTNITFRGIEFFGFVPSGTEANWAAMQDSDSYGVQWAQQPFGIRRHGGTTNNITVEYCLFRFTGNASMGLEFCANSLVRRNAFTYSRGDFVKFEGSHNSIFEDNISFKTAGGGSHIDGYQSTSKVQNGTEGCIFRRNIMTDLGGGKMQGIFVEQDSSSYAGGKNNIVEDNIVFIASKGGGTEQNPTSQATAKAICIAPSGGGNKVRYNTVLTDIHRGWTTANIMLLLEYKRTGTPPTGDEAKYNVADSYSVTTHASQAGNMSFGETTYGTHLYNYSSSTAKIDGLLSATNGAGTFIFQPSVLQRLAWKVGSTLYDPNYNGQAGAWRAFQSYGATPPGWTLGGGGGGDTQAPSVPGTPTASNITSSSVTLAWTASTDNVGVTGYKVYTNGANPVTVTGTSYTKSGLAASTTYTFTVSAHDAAGNNSAQSAGRQATTLAGGGTLPSPWVTAGIGSTAGTASVSSGTWTISGGGLDIAGTSDAFRYVYQPLSGDATITVKVNSLTNSSAWAKAGVMIRDGLAANAKFAMANSTPTTKQEFKYRTSTGGTAAGVAVTGTALPNWVRLTRAGNVFTAFRSSNGTTWTQMGTAQTITMGTTVYIGMPVCAQHSSSTTTASISSVTISGGTTPPPTSWTGANIGSPPVAGSFSESSGTWTIVGSGIDIAGTSDKFYFVYKQLSGNCDVRVRVQSLTNTSMWAKAGIMIRDGLAANAKFAMTNSTPGSKQEFKYRTSTGGTAAGAAVTTTAPANWVRLVRSSNSFTGYTSSDGVTWTQRGTTQSITMGTTVYVGFVVCAQHASSSTTGVFTNVTGMP